MLKKNGGITLIALVVTIIVLLILAGITIAMLTGPNGIISRTNDSKVKQIEGQVQEEVKLAVQSAKIHAMQKSVETPGGGWYASKHLNDANEGIIAVLREDLTSTRGYTTITGTDATTDDATVDVTITYTTDDYEKATNTPNASIVTKVKVKQNSFRISLITANGVEVYKDTTAL